MGAASAAKIEPDAMKCPDCGFAQDRVIDIRGRA